MRHLFVLAMHLEIKSIMQTNTIEMESRALTPVRNMATRDNKGDFSVGTVSSVRAADKTAQSDDGHSPHNHLSASSDMREVGYSSLTPTYIVDLGKLKDCELN
jgi:hypothetical protein